MPIYATTEAKEFWEQSLKPTTRARSLAAAKFVTLTDGKEDKSTWRKASCEAIAKGVTLVTKSVSFAQFTTTLLAQGAAILHAKLEARLIIDAGGGVIENGGICLDRTSGIPFIPGSAVKGCARRFAIHRLSDENDPAAKAILLAQIAILFGYGDQEWKAGRQKESVRSDFWLAMVPLFDAGPESDAKRNDLWPTVSEQAAKLVFEALGRTPKEPEMPLAPQLPNLSGTVSFLPAYPENDLGVEIDVLTPHHPKYYSGANPTATDDEDPNPVLFPTIAPLTIFRFPLVPLSQGARASYPQLFSSGTSLEFARTCLAESLQLFGLGAKTNAGYGWFSIDKTAEKKAADALAAEKEAQDKAARLALLSPKDQAAETIQALNDEDFAKYAKAIATKAEPEQQAFFEILLKVKKDTRNRWKKNKPEIWKPLCEVAATLNITLP
jgi:CRISPR-associated protein Cmr6